MNRLEQSERENDAAIARLADALADHRHGRPLDWHEIADLMVTIDGGRGAVPDATWERLEPLACDGAAPAHDAPRVCSRHAFQPLPGGTREKCTACGFTRRRDVDM